MKLQLGSLPKIRIWTGQWREWFQELYRWVTGTQWYTPTLLNSWEDYGGSHSPARYRKVCSIVELQGLIRNGTTTAGTDLFILPVGFRPQYRLIFIVISNSAIGRVDVFSDGTVEIQAGSSTWLNLTGITFKAEG